jgi:Zn-dependent M28 family amino/carboxypeptidase
MLLGAACTDPVAGGTPFTTSGPGTQGDDDTEADPDDDDGSTGDPSASTAPGSSGGGSTTDASSSDGGSSGVPECSPAPSPDPDWLYAYQDDLVAKLSGATEIAAGVALGERSTPSQRAAAAAFLDDAFAEIGYTPQRHDYPGGSNVFAELPALDGDAPVLVVGAHYDTVPGSPGANDNATGVAMVLALARHLLEVECRSHHLLFVLFDQEEIGLVGSNAFAGFLVDEGLPIEAVHTIDQMGWDADGDRRVEIERADAGLFDFYDEHAGSLVPPIELTATQTGFTDHVSFRDHGLPAVGLTEEFVSGDTSPHYHQPSDAYATVDVGFLVSTTILANLAFSERIDAAQ